MDLLKGSSCVQPFDLDGEKATLGTRWLEYMEDIDIYLEAANINDERRKKAIMLHLGGQGLRRVAKTLDCTPRAEVLAVVGPPAVAAVPAESPYAALKRVLTGYFQPQANKDLQRVCFRETTQAANESLDQYRGRLQKLAVGCDFGNIEDEVRTQILLKAKSPKLRQAAIEDQLTLDQILAKGRAMEAAQLHLSHTEKRPEVATVNRVRGEKWHHKQNKQHQGQQQNSHHKGRGGQNQQRGKQGPRNQQQHQQQPNSNPQDRPCAYCGGAFHPGGLKTCPARGKVCYNCQKYDHYGFMCRSPSQSGGNSQQQQQQYKKPGRRGRVNAIADQRDDEYGVGESDDDEYSHHLLSNVGSGKKEYPAVELNLEGVGCSFLLDTGANRTIINKQAFKSIGSPQLQSTDLRIYPYKSKTPLNLEGVFVGLLDVPIQMKGTEEKIYVTADGANDICILSGQAAQRLGLISYSPSVRLCLLSAEIKNNQLPKIGRLKGVRVKLHIDESVPPVAVPYSASSSIHHEKLIIEEIKVLDALDLVEPPKGPTPWVNRNVMAWKPGGYRFCQDMRAANKAIKRTRHILPTVDDILAKVSGAKWFSVLDMNSAFNQLELEEASRYITVFPTPLGLRQWKVLFFGVNCASEIFHNAIGEVLRDLPGVLHAIDDICVFGKTREEHDANYARLMRRLEEINLTTQQKKNQICQQRVSFWGIVLTDKGIEMDPAKAAAVVNCSRPASSSEVRSFVGMINYCARFVKGQADLAAPLRKLAAAPDSEFAWSQECERAFQLLKQQLSEPKTLAYYNPNYETELVVDASPVGLGAILTQVDDIGRSSVVAYASKALTPVEQRYSQTEREGYAVVWGCERFRYYLLGGKFICWTDHKALVPIFNNPHAKLPLRLERFLMRTQGFNMTVAYRPGESNAADYLSRHPDPATSFNNQLTEKATAHVNAMVEWRVPRLVPPEEVAAATAADGDLQLVCAALDTGKAYRIPDRLSAYRDVFNELSRSETGLLLRGERICIPTTLQRQVTLLAHEGHQGSNKTKRLLRSSVWFPAMDKMVESVIKECAACIVSTSAKTRTPLVMSKLPNEPWMELSMDFYTFPDSTELLVVMDDYSRYPVVAEVSSTAFRFVEKALGGILSEFGVPVTIRTDNGPPFNGKDFAAYAAKMGFNHRTVTYAWPEANGLVERFMRSLSKVFRTASAAGVHWQTQLNDFLRNYRATPHPATGVSPHALLFGRQPNTRLTHVQQSDAEYKQRIKEAADRRRRVQEHSLKIGDRVFRRKEGKLLRKDQPFYEEEQYVVTAVHGSAVTARNYQHTVTRHASFFRKVPPQHGCIDEGEEEREELLPPPNQVDPVPAEPAEHPPAAVPARQRRRPQAAAPSRRNPGRQRDVPVRFRDDYVLGSKK